MADQSKRPDVTQYKEAADVVDAELSIIRSNVNTGADNLRPAVEGAEYVQGLVKEIAGMPTTDAMIIGQLRRVLDRHLDQQGPADESPERRLLAEIRDRLSGGAA